MVGLWLVILLGCSNVGDDSFRQGLESLREGDSSTAVTALSDALDEGGRNAGVYHAMGNSLYRLDRKAEAAAAWRRGLLLAPRDGDIAANLEHVRGQFRDRLEPPVQHHPIFFWQSEMAPIESAGIASIALSVAFWIAVVGRFRRLRGGAALPSAAVLSQGIAASVGLLLLVSTFDSERGRDSAIVVAEEVEVRSALGPAGVSLFVLHAGAEVAVEDQTDTHQLISLSDGRKGWVSAKVLLSTNPAAPFVLDLDR